MNALNLHNNSLPPPYILKVCSNYLHVTFPNIYCTPFLIFAEWSYWCWNGDSPRDWNYLLPYSILYARLQFSIPHYCSRKRDVVLSSSQIAFKKGNKIRKKLLKNSRMDQINLVEDSLWKNLKWCGLFRQTISLQIF